MTLLDGSLIRYFMPIRKVAALRVFTVFAVFALLTLSGCQQLTKTFKPTESPYQRKDWPHWIDVDKNCRNTRQELLIVTSQKPVQYKDTRQCTVKAGKWIGPYTGKTLTKASDVDIDHIVPLAHAHRHGAANWTRAQRRTFANDFENLLVVDDATNQAKSNKAPHEWLPPNKAFWCEYGQRWQRVKDKYRLFYSDPERNVLERLSAYCLH